MSRHKAPLPTKPEHTTVAAFFWWSNPQNASELSVKHLAISGTAITQNVSLALVTSIMTSMEKMPDILLSVVV